MILFFIIHYLFLRAFKGENSHQIIFLVRMDNHDTFYSYLLVMPRENRGSKTFVVHFWGEEGGANG